MDEKMKTEEGAPLAEGAQMPVSEAPVIDMLEDTMEEIIEAASVDRVFGEPVRNDGTVIIPAAEVMTGLGFGGGYGTGMAKRAMQHRGRQGESMKPSSQTAGGAPEEGGGLGGGGRVSARPVAVIIADNSGVRVEPVIDRTKIALSAIIAGGLSMLMLMRLIRKW